MAAGSLVQGVARRLFTQLNQGQPTVSASDILSRTPQLRWISGSASQAAGGRCCCAAESESLPPTVSAEPGTVTPHTHHIFLRLPAPHGFNSTNPTFEAWWPPLVEKEPGVVRAFSAVATAMKQWPSHVGGVKVSAIIEVGSSGGSNAGHDVMLFPQGVEYLNVQLDHIGSLISHHLHDDKGVEGAREPPPGVTPPLELQGAVCLFVCCHGARDSRCGAHGPPLAAALMREIESLETEGTVPEGAMRVFQCSHIGGHKYAGNVLVHGSISACDGDWFGGVKAKHAKKFVRNLVFDPGCAGGHDHPGMRQWWRGRIGMSKEEQIQMYANPPASVNLDSLEDDGDGGGDSDNEYEEDFEDVEMEMGAGSDHGGVHELNAEEMAQFDHLVREMGIDREGQSEDPGNRAGEGADDAQAMAGYARVMQTVMPGLSMEEMEAKLEAMNEEEFAVFFEQFNAALDQHISEVQDDGEVEGPTLPYGNAETSGRK